MLRISLRDDLKDNGGRGVAFILISGKRDVCRIDCAPATGSHLTGDSCPTDRTIHTSIGKVRVSFFHNGAPCAAALVDGD